ncbi:hypothetical protein PoB_004010100 [Plakobranchus ocellatus]|uniref:Uncharacterized protein n=1 Tax=Plakobranchus ocellatus TaxID=259542 RepID=A0AAV4AZ83_9GAST|nr:hypothetical protein PoB_004010100 [Plakobranchus ocellatus]
MGPFTKINPADILCNHTEPCGRRWFIPPTALQLRVNVCQGVTNASPRSCVEMISAHLLPDQELQREGIPFGRGGGSGRQSPTEADEFLKFESENVGLSWH